MTDLTQVPIACVLNAAALADRAGAWQQLMAEGLIAGEQREEGVRLRFDGATAARARTLVALEAQCCAWFRGTVTADGDEVVVDLIAAGDGPRVLQTMFLARTGGDGAPPPR